MLLPERHCNWPRSNIHKVQILSKRLWLIGCSLEHIVILLADYFQVFFVFFSAFCCSLVRWRERCDITKTWLVISSTFKSWSIFYQLLLHYCCVAPTVSQTNHIFIWLWIMTHCNNLAAIKVTHFNYKCFLFFFKLSQHDTDICSHSHRRVYMATLMSGWQETTSHDARYFMGMCIHGPVGIIWKKLYS